MKMRSAVSIGIGLSLLAVAWPAAARDSHWRTEIRVGPSHHDRWHSGRWHHGWRDGRLGWWWVSGNAWHYYPERVFPYPEPVRPPIVVVSPQPQVLQPPPVLMQQTAPAVWYFCEAVQAYYPYVNSCPTGWKTVPAVPAQP